MTVITSDKYIYLTESEIGDDVILVLYKKDDDGAYKV